jgi:hypothetical protein
MTLFSESGWNTVMKMGTHLFLGILVLDPDLIDFGPASSHSCVIHSWVQAEKSVICSWNWAILDVVLKVAGFENCCVKS